MPSESPHAGRQQPEPDRAAAVAVIDAIDHGRQFLPPVVLEQIKLMAGGRHQVEQHNADRQRLVARDTAPEPVETGEKKAGVARFMEIDLIPAAAEIANP
jgi:hypothetical protein